MPKASESKTFEKQPALKGKSGFKKLSQPKAVLDILMLLDWTRLEPEGVERTLGGLHRLLPVEKSTLHLLHVNKPSKHTVGEMEPDALLNRVQTTLQKFHWQVAETRMQELTHELTVNIIGEIRKADYDLVVLCSPELPPGGQSAFSNFVQQVTSQVPVSVLIWRKPLSEQPHPMKVVFAVDGSESSLTAVNKSTQLLHLKYAQLQVVTVLSPIFQDNAVTAPFVNPDILEQALEANARMIFDMANGLLESQGFQKSACKKLIGSPATELGYYAELEAPDLIVVGSHNRKGLMAWLMGSVSSQLLHWDQHNLLIVR